MKDKIKVEINISDANDTPKYLEILRKHDKTLSKFLGGKVRERKSIFNEESCALDDEDAKLLAIRQKHALEFVLGEIENHKKRGHNKLPTAKAIQTFIQKEKERSLKEDGEYGEFFAFLTNLLDARLEEFYGVNLLPKSDTQKEFPREVVLGVIPELEVPIAVERQRFESINIENIAERVFKKRPHLAKNKKLVTTVIKSLLEIK